MADETVAWAPGSSDPKVAFEEFKLHLRSITPRLYVVPTVIGLCVLVYAAMVATGVSPINPTAVAAMRWGADYGPLTQGGQAWRLLSNVFVHFGAVHLCLNMLALASAGPIVERLFGPLAFLAIYFTAAITGSLASLTLHPLTVSAGASGAIFGVYGALGALVLRQQEAIPRVIFSKLGGVAGSFIIYNLVFGMGHAGIDNAAHFGGVLGGGAAGLWLSRPLVAARPAARLRPALAMGAACLLALGVPQVLPRPVSFDQIVNDYVADEKEALATYDGVLKRMKSGASNTFEAADIIEKGIISDWQQTRARLEARERAWGRQQPATSVQRQLLARIQELAAVRETYWWRMVNALRRHETEEFSAIRSESQQKTHDLIEQVNDLERRIDSNG